MKKQLTSWMGILCLLIGTNGYTQSRTTVRIPDILGYKTLKADLHIHTIFSDGRVWPDIRVEEAWRDGLDVIAITDHINYRGAVLKDHLVYKDKNAHYNEAITAAKTMGITLIKAVEYNAPDQLGHYNFLFLEDINAIEIDRKNPLITFETAKNQGAFIQWNHPPYKHSDKEDIGDLPKQLIQKKWLDGIEIVGHVNQFDQAMLWAENYQLAPTASSDIHFLIDTRHEEFHRPMTLILAKDNSIEEIKKALVEGRTLGYHQNKIIGKEEYTKAIFNASVKVHQLPCFTYRNRQTFAIENNSDIPYRLTLISSTDSYGLPAHIYLPPHKTILNKMRVPKGNEDCSAIISGIYEVENLLNLKGEKVQVELVLDSNKP